MNLVITKFRSAKSEINTNFFSEGQISNNNISMKIELFLAQIQFKMNVPQENIIMKIQWRAVAITLYFSVWFYSVGGF